MWLTVVLWVQKFLRNFVRKWESLSWNSLKFVLKIRAYPNYLPNEICKTIQVFCKENDVAIESARRHKSLNPEFTGQIVDMRVGVHSGRVIYGIVGSKRYKFDVYSQGIYFVIFIPIKTVLFGYYWLHFRPRKVIFFHRTNESIYKRSEVCFFRHQWDSSELEHTIFLKFWVMIELFKLHVTAEQIFLVKNR